MKFKVGDKVRVISRSGCHSTCEDCPFISKEIVEILEYSKKEIRISVVFNGKKCSPCNYVTEKDLQLVMLTQSQRLGL